MIAAAPPGLRYAVVGGRRLAYTAQGAGATVVLETGSGSGGIGLAWSGVAQRIAEFATVLTYDRAGTGFSDPLAAPPTLVERADDLAGLLAATGVRAPAVLVGWSLGGLIAQQFAVAHAASVAGLVLVDPTPVDSYAPFKPWQRRLMLLPLRLIAALARLGLFKTQGGRALLRRMLLAQFGPRFDPALIPVLLEAAGDARMHETVLLETARLPESCDAAATLFAAQPLPHVPLIVLSAGWRGHGSMATRFGPRILAAHRRLAESVPGGELRVLEDVSHHVPFEAPDAIARAVRDVLARAAARLPGLPAEGDPAPQP